MLYLIKIKLVLILYLIKIKLILYFIPLNYIQITLKDIFKLLYY